MSKTARAYKYRSYTADEQKHIFAQMFGCCRFVYNWGLSARKTAYFQHGQKLTYDDLSAMLPNLKKEHPPRDAQRAFLTEQEKRKTGEGPKKCDSL